MDNNKNNNQLKDKLWESEERFKAAFESAKDCILIWDKDYNYLYANQAAIDHVGTTPDKVIGKNIRDGLGHIPDFMHLWMGRIDQIFESGKVLKFQDKTMMQESIMFSESILTPIFKQDGSVAAVCVVYRDITERKQDEDILKRQKDFSESIINTSNAIIIGLDKNHKIQLFNEGAEKITGYQKAEMIDKDWFHMFFPSDIVEDMIGVWDEAWGIKFHSYINPILTKNGDSRMISWQTTGMYEGDEENHLLISIGEDITESKRAEQQYKDLVEKAGIAILVDDSKGNFDYFNKRFCDIFGFTSKEMKGKSIPELVHPEDVEDVMTRHNNRQKGELEKSRYNFRGVRKDGSIIYLEVDAVLLDEKSSSSGTRSYMWDISDRRTAEEKLRESEAHYRLLLDSLPYGGEILDSDGRIIDCSQKTSEMLGYKKEELIGKPITNFVDESTVNLFKENFPKLFRGESISVEAVMVAKNGDRINIIRAADPIVNEENEITNVLALNIDITERKLAEEKLKKSETQLKNILENSTSLYYSHTPDHLLTYLSPQVEEVLGYTVEEAMVKWTELASENPINTTGFQHTVRAIETCRRQPPYELELVRKDGRKINVEVREFPLVENGKTTAIVGSLLDITERKKAGEELRESEEKLRTTIENINDIIIWKMDEKGVFTYLSPAVTGILGYDPKEMEGTLGFSYFRPEDKPLMEKNMAARIIGDRTPNELEMVAKDGSLISMELISSPIKNEKGENVGFSGTARDITARKTAEAEIMKLKDGLEKEVAEKTIELKEKVDHLERFYNATVDRELRMKELYDENVKLKEELEKKK